MIKYPVRKTLEEDRSVNKRRYNAINTYSFDLRCDIEIPCDGKTGLRSESESVYITLHPSYDRMGNYKGTMVNCSVGWQYCYRGLRKGIREYDWIEVLKMFPSLTFRNKSRAYFGGVESIKGIIIKEFHIKKASFELKVVYDNFGPKITLLENNLKSLTGRFKFIIQNNGELEYIIESSIHQNDSYLVVYRDMFKSNNLKGAFVCHDLALCVCECYMDNYIKEQHWSNCLEL